MAQPSYGAVSAHSQKSFGPRRDSFVIAKQTAVFHQHCQAGGLFLLETGYLLASAYTPPHAVGWMLWQHYPIYQWVSLPWTEASSISSSLQHASANRNLRNSGCHPVKGRSSAPAIRGRSYTSLDSLTVYQTCRISRQPALLTNG